MNLYNNNDDTKKLTDLVYLIINKIKLFLPNPDCCSHTEVERCRKEMTILLDEISKILNS